MLLSVEEAVCDLELKVVLCVVKVGGKVGVAVVSEVLSAFGDDCVMLV